MEIPLNAICLLNCPNAVFPKPLLANQQNALMCSKPHPHWRWIPTADQTVCRRFADCLACRVFHCPDGLRMVRKPFGQWKWLQTRRSADSDRRPSGLQGGLTFRWFCRKPRRSQTVSLHCLNSIYSASVCLPRIGTWSKLVRGSSEARHSVLPFISWIQLYPNSNNPNLQGKIQECSWVEWNKVWQGLV